MLKKTALNRRMHKRQPAQFSFSFRIAGAEHFPVQSAVCYDISVRSLGFRSAQPIPLESKLDLRLSVPPSAKPLYAKGTVRRVEKTPEDDLYAYGLVIDEIEKSDLALLAHFVHTSDINAILRAAFRRKASDVHFVAHHPPIFRIGGELFFQEAFPLNPPDLREMIMTILTEKQIGLFERNLELDFSYLTQDGIRFRGNVHQEKGHVEVSFRHVPAEARSAAELGLPAVVEELVKKKRGLILITGPSGSGKSTTLTTMIDLINRQRKAMIISLEDPIEFIHQSHRSVIKQREVGRDTQSFNQGLKYILRQDVDVILVGEMRDLESISLVISAAETGHLVLSTLHTSDATEALNRIIDAYPEEQQRQVRGQLAGCLEAIIAQLLLPRADQGGRILAAEVLLASPAIRNVIRTGQLGQLPFYLEAGASQGMRTMDNALIDLARRGLIGKDTALNYAREGNKILQAL